MQILQLLSKHRLQCLVSAINFKIFNIFPKIVSKGIGANMLKVGSKRRRTKNEIEEEKQMEAERKE